MGTSQALNKAAEKLKARADEIRIAHTFCGGVWMERTDEVRKEYEELLVLAIYLRAMA